MNTFKAHFNNLRDSFKKLGKQPVFDWYFAFTCFLVSVAIIALVDISFYYKLSADDLTEDNVTKSDSMALSKEKVSKTLEQARQKEVDARVVPTRVLNDPSI